MNNKKNNKEKEMINKLVLLYFKYNPNMDKGIGYRIKANDIISSYYYKHKMKYKDIKDCIESNPMSNIPIWELFYNYWYLNNNNNEKSNYKDSISNSTNPDDWI